MSLLHEIDVGREHGPGVAGPSAGRSDGSPIGEAFARLSAVVTTVAGTVDASTGRRCPHRGARSRCHFPGACCNQTAVGEVRVCTGDTRVRFEPVAHADRLSLAGEAP